MHRLIAWTFGGLSPSYYWRHFIFGLTIPAFVLLMLSQSPEGHQLRLPMLMLLILNTVLYPYSRFVYESIVNFIVGQNVFVVNAVLMLAVKIATMVFCWALAVFIAPIGLAYLYFHHCRASK